MFPRSSRTGDALPQARTCFSVASIEKQIEVTLLSWCKVERAAAQKRASRRSETRLKAVRNPERCMRERRKRMGAALSAMRARFADGCGDHGPEEA